MPTDIMESGLRPSGSVASRISHFDVGQLDKINAIPNKTTNDVLLDGLSAEDKLYLDTLMDEDSSESDTNDDLIGASPWSTPMAERPMRMGGNKRVKRIMMKPSYAITLSLEDISYIRPSWGISKGQIKRISVKKTRKGQAAGGRRLMHRNSDLKKRTIEGNPRASANKTATNDDDQETNADKIEIDQLEDGEDKASESAEGRLNSYHMFLLGVILILSGLVLLSYSVDLSRHNERTRLFQIELQPGRRYFDIFKEREQGGLETNQRLRVHYGRGIPANLRHQECTCAMYEAETRRFSVSDSRAGDDDDDDDDEDGEDQGGAGENESKLEPRKCFACNDWAMRANMQMFVNKSQHSNLLALNQSPSTLLLNDLGDQSITCYDVRWQSYDTLATPLVDCLQLADSEQWLGLGDMQTADVWPVNKLESGREFVPLMSNLSAEFRRPSRGARSSAAAVAAEARDIVEPEVGLNRPNFGSHVELTLISSNGFLVSGLRTDLQPAIRISAAGRELCLSATCGDKCTRLWSRPFEGRTRRRLRNENNLFQYSICSARNWRLLSSRLLDERVKSFARRANSSSATSEAAHFGRSEAAGATRAAPSERRTESDTGRGSRSATLQNREQNLSEGVAASPPSPPPPPARPQPQPIGLIERTIFQTSPEFMGQLDGQTLREFVDKIVKLNLRTSPILVIDTRWQTHVGSLKLNAAHFPKAKLLFEILHNKGFKIVLTLKPYIDVNISIGSLKQLVDFRRLVTAQFGADQLLAAAAARARLALVSPQRHTSWSSSSSSSRLDQGQLDASLQKQSGGQQQPSASPESMTVVRRHSFFEAHNETVHFRDSLELSLAERRQPRLFECRESYSEHCVLIDLVAGANRAWLVDLIRRSSFLSQEADAILVAGAHPEPAEWESRFRPAMGRLVDELFHGERIYTLPQWTGNFNYLQLAPRPRTWAALNSIVDSVLALGLQGYSLVHPGSVWGDLGDASPYLDSELAHDAGAAASMGAETSGSHSRGPLAERLRKANGDNDEDTDAERELAVRWLQLAVFLPILQFSDLEPIERHQLHDQVQTLVRIRKLQVVPEIKRNLPYTPLVHQGGLDEYLASRPAGQQLPQHHLAAHRYTWTQADEPVAGQFMIGNDMLVAPVLAAGQRQKDIYLPGGIWRDELRQTDVRGAKWLRNYPVELHEVAWFTRARR